MLITGIPTQIPGWMKHAAFLPLFLAIQICLNSYNMLEALVFRGGLWVECDFIRSLLIRGVVRLGKYKDFKAYPHNHLSNDSKGGVG